MKISNPRPVYQKPTGHSDDKKFLNFLRGLSCCVCGKPPRSQAAHYRTAANSGVATKPLRSAVPMCHQCHSEQHRIGQFNFMPREKWEELVDKHLKLFDNTVK